MRRFLLSLLLSFVCLAPAMAADMTRQEVESIIREYLMKNPQVIIDSVNEFGKSQQEAENKKSEEAVKANMDWLVKNPKHAEAGNPNGDITIVEFFDYNCGYCKQAMTDVMDIMDTDKKIRLVFIEIPILGEGSFEAARWALAAKNQGKYLEYHIALMRHRGAYNEAILADYAKKVGLDVEKMKKDKADPALNAILDENLNMASQFGISGTPAFVVGTQVVRGYVPAADMRQIIAQQRQ